MESMAPGFAFPESDIWRPLHPMIRLQRKKNAMVFLQHGKSKTSVVIPGVFSHNVIVEKKDNFRKGGNVAPVAYNSIITGWKT